jgi:teichuronic acid biosynthesis glycosyltransferase TuaC
MKILTLSTTFPNPQYPGRGGFVRARLARLADRAEVKVVAPVQVVNYWQLRAGRRTSGPAVPAERMDGKLEVFHPRWMSIPLGGGLNGLALFAQVLGLAKTIRQRFPFELIDAHFAFPDGIAAWLLARSLGVPYLVTLRGNETLHAGHRFRRMLIRRALCKADRVISVAVSLRQFAISLGVDPAKAVTIPNGIDPGIFYPRDRAASRRKYGIADGQRIILSVGALIERKGHHRVMRALHELRAEQVRACLLIAGSAGPEGLYEEPLRKLVGELGLQDQVRFLGQVAPETLPELMSAADVLCLATTREGWPNVVHEALACGTPVVATDVGGIPDMIPSEEHGIVVPVNQPAALRDALRKALAKSWDHAAISARARARSWDQVAAEVFEQMHQVLAEQAQRQETRKRTSLDAKPL